MADIPFDEIFKARMENIVRMALAIGIEGVDKMVARPDGKWKIATAIARWYKKHPQPKRRATTPGVPASVRRDTGGA